MDVINRIHALTGDPVYRCDFAVEHFSGRVFVTALKQILDLDKRLRVTAAGHGTHRSPPHLFDEIAAAGAAEDKQFIAGLLYHVSHLGCGG